MWLRGRQAHLDSMLSGKVCGSEARSAASNNEHVCPPISCDNDTTDCKSALLASECYSTCKGPVAANVRQAMGHPAHRLRDHQPAAVLSLMDPPGVCDEMLTEL